MPEFQGESSHFLFISQEARSFKHQGATVDAIVVLQLNQGGCKKSAVYLFLLDFLVLLHQDKRTENLQEKK